MGKFWLPSLLTHQSLITEVLRAPDPRKHSFSQMGLLGTLHSTMCVWGGDNQTVYIPAFILLTVTVSWTFPSE